MKISPTGLAPADPARGLGAELEAFAAQVTAARAALAQAARLAKASPADRSLRARLVVAKKNVEQASAAYQRTLSKVPAYERPDEDAGWSFTKAMSELHSLDVDIGRLKAERARAQQAHGAKSAQTSAIDKRLHHLLTVERPREVADFQMSQPRNRLFASPGEDHGENDARMAAEFEQASALKDHLSQRLQQAKGDRRALPEHLNTLARQQAAAAAHLQSELDDHLDDGKTVQASVSSHNIYTTKSGLALDAAQRGDEVIFLQEAEYSRLLELAPKLSRLGYACIPGKKEGQTPIFYRRGRFDLIDHAWHGLATKDDPTTGEKKKIGTTRYANAALLRRKDGDETVLYVNVHLDNWGSPENQVGEVNKMLDAFHKVYKIGQVVIGGDYNTHTNVFGGKFNRSEQKDIDQFSLWTDRDRTSRHNFKPLEGTYTDRKKSGGSDHDMVTATFATRNRAVRDLAAKRQYATKPEPTLPKPQYSVKTARTPG